MMILNNPARFNIFKLENELKKGKDSYLNFIDEILESKGLEKTLDIIKASGLGVNLFNNKKQKELLEAVVEHLLNKVDIEDKILIAKFLFEIKCFEVVYQRFTEQRDQFFNKHEKASREYRVVSYLISLELCLSSLIKKEKDFNDPSFLPENLSEFFQLQSNVFDSAVESSGMILKNFMYTNNEFVGSKRNISPKTLHYSSYHILFSEVWNRLNDILEYWKYSKVNVELSEKGKIFFNVLDKDFQYNNLISNERFINLRDGWQIGAMGDFYEQFFDQGGISEEHEKSIKSSLNYMFAVLYFGSPLLNVEIKGIQLIKWVKAYELLIDESNKFLSKRKNIKSYNLSKVCICKTFNQWKRLFTNNGFTDEESTIIVEVFTFDKKSQDLIDCPLVKIDDNLVIIPSVTSNADVARALASNFINRGFNLNFKGPEFEKRIREMFDQVGIKNNRLYKKIDGTEYECDIAFVIDQELFLVECKAHVQPYTTRQHAIHLYKLYEGTSQLNRIADYFEENIDIVEKQLDVGRNFKPIKVHRILLTTSMIGSPLFINGVYIVDESSLTKFLYRDPPVLLSLENGKYKKKFSDKYDLYKGEITASKLIRFLTFPPQIEIAKELFKEKYLSLGLFDIREIVKVNDTVHYVKPNQVLSEDEKKLLDKLF